MLTENTFNKGWRNEATAPDGTVLVRKHSTRPYAFALLRERDGSWVLEGMSATKDGALALRRKWSPNSYAKPYIVVTVKATEIRGKRRIKDQATAPMSEGSLQNGNYECAGREE